jgi:hypothetical protein
MTKPLALILIALAVPASARAASFTTPGYHGTHHVPKVVATTPPPVRIGTGSHPNILVDAAGTAHIVWDETVPGDGDRLHYCRLPRGANACAASSVLKIDQPDVDGNNASNNTDTDGPRALAIGDELLLLSNRGPNLVPVPGCTDPDPSACEQSDSNDYLFTSEDGGTTFGAPGRIGTNPATFGVVTFGGESPFIATLSSPPGQGLTFQASHAGQFATDAASFGAAEAGGNGSCCLLAVDPATGRPAVAVSNGGQVVVREWNATGSPNDATQWSTSAPVPGAGQPALAAANGALYLAVTPCDACDQTIVRRVVGGAVGPAVAIGPASNELTLAGGSGGTVDAVFNTQDNGGQLVVRHSTDGTAWSAAQVLATGGAHDDPRAAVGPDGGGVAVWADGSGDDAAIEVSGFGPTGATGQLGLGSVGGGSSPIGGGGDGATSCTTVHMGDIDALSEAGCFLRDPQHPASGAAVTDGELRLNGLQIVPDAGVRVVIDPHARTIDTTGAVSVILRGSGIGDITLWHGELHVKLGSAADGQTLFDFDTSTFAAALKGFPIDGKIDVVLAHDAVKIPIALKLPPYFGGITGQATLEANNRDGLVLDSLQIGVPDAILGALEIKDLNISYTREGDVWSGGAKFNVPPRSGEFAIDVQVTFTGGKLTMGSFGVGFYPGIPIFSDLYLNHFGGGFALSPRKKIFGDVSVGAIPLDPPNYAINVDGTFSITFGENGEPTVIEVGGTGAVHGEDIANAKLIFQTNGYFEADGNVDIDLGVVGVSGGIKAFADLPAKRFSGDIHGTVFVGGFGLVSAESLIANTGMGACGKLEVPPFPALAGGFFWAWGTSADDVEFEAGTCDLSQYKVAPVSAAARAEGAGAGVGVTTATVAAGTDVENIELLGDGGAPSVTLTSPTGRVIEPSTSDVSAPAYALRFDKAGRTVVVLNHPEPGAWRVALAPGSVAVRRASAAGAVAPPRVHAHVHGHRLVYRIDGWTPGAQITFGERAGRVYHELGTARGAAGHLEFVPGDGRGGRRSLFALVSVGGLPRQRIALGSYVAPPPPRPARVRGLRVRRSGRSFVVRFAGAKGAARYLIDVRASDGRRIQRLTQTHTLRLPALGYGDHVRVRVAGQSAVGRSGRATTGRA